MTRLALLRDGTAVGRFTQRHHETHVVILEPNGHAFTYVGSDGRASRHLTPTLLSTQRPLVAATVAFRNRYAWCTNGGDDIMRPYLHTALGDRPTHTRRRGLSAVGWPNTKEFKTDALWNDQHKCWEVASLDGAARVQLDASGNVVDVAYLVEIQPGIYAWIDQRFMTTATPPCFAFPVQLLRQARVARGAGNDLFRLDAHNANEPTAVTLPRNSAIDARPTFRPLEGDGSAERIVRWIKGLSRALDRRVVVEQADGVEWVVDVVKLTVWILNHTTANTTRSLIECDRGFFRAFDRAGGVTQQFTVETMPLELETFGRDYHVTTAILLHATELFDASSHDHPPALSTPAASDTDDASPATVVEELVNDVGRFRAFSDGRVRIVFADRTILQVLADDCWFTYRDGSTGRCTSDSASPAQLPYVRVAIEFGDWAFATPAERFRRHELQVEQQQRIASELHKITIRQELNSVTSRDVHDVVDNARPVPPVLTPDAVAQLQRETAAHMTHVQTLLHETHGD